MERIQTRIASTFVPKDIISNMPDIVVTNILDRLPLRDAVRTSILSRHWRFKWTVLSQLVFDKNFFKRLLNTKNKDKYGKIVTRLLLHLIGTITKFVLYIDKSIELDDEDINHWILFLSRKRIKHLSIWNINGLSLKLPTHLFSCLELNHLELFNCCFDPPASFHSFPKLLSLKFTMVQSKSMRFGKFITRCPSLEILNIHLSRPLHEIWTMHVSSKDKVKLVEIAKLANLKILSLSLCQLHNIKIKNSSSIFELVGFLPKLQQLELDFINCKFIDGGANNRLRSVFPCLTDLKLTSINLGNGVMLSSVVELIRSFPNLQTLEVTASKYYAYRSPVSPNVDYNTMRLLKLRNVVFRGLIGSKNEEDLIECLLACSPFLEKIAIRLQPFLASGGNLFVTKLLKLSRASPLAEIKLY